MTTVSSLINPFEADQEKLVSLASGFVFENDIADKLLDSEKLGEEQFVEFANKNLLGENPDIFVKLKRNKITTFPSSKRVTVKDSKGKEINMKMNRNLFALLLLIAKNRKIDLEEVLSYSLGSYPLSLATTSGSLVKTAKSKLFDILEDVHGHSEFDKQRYHNNALIIDAMAVLQALKGIWKTFGELCDSIFNMILTLAREWNATRLDFVSDRYPAISIKSSERNRRAENAGIQKVHIFNKDQNVPKQWKKFLSSGENKESLIGFLCEHWRTYMSSRFGNLTTLYVTSKEKCYRFSIGASNEDRVVCNELPFLASNHEEADTRLLLHAKHAAGTNDRVIVKSPDTDVFILCIAMQRAIGKDIFLMTGTGNKFRVIPIKVISDMMGEELCQCLPAFHAFSGSDSTSSFYGKGKKTAWATLEHNPRYIATFSSLRSTFPPSDELVTQLNRFVCLLYGDKKSENVNKCRFLLFKSGKCSDDVLPPTSDSLLQHILRANYQAAIWYQCLDAEMVIPPPNGNGWQVSDGQLEIVWMTRPPAPDSLLECVQCSCKTGCKTLRCSCKKAQLKCTDICSCVDCINATDKESEEELGGEISGSDMDDEIDDYIQ